VSSRPPDPGRLRAARAAGLRPRASWLGLALLALGLALLVPSSLELPAAWLARQLERAFEGSPRDAIGSGPLASLPRGIGLALLAASLLALIALRLGSAPRLPLRPAIDPRRAQIGVATRIGLCSLGILISLWMLAPVVAAAARSVDAPPDALAILWSTWLRRALLVVSASAGAIALLEWLASARALWLALHTTPEQDRESRHTRMP